MTYTLLNLIFLALACTAWYFARKIPPTNSSHNGYSRTPKLRSVILTSLILVTLTIVFDNVMIACGLMTYSDAHTSGVTLGLMPVEDLAYTLWAVIALPSLWSLFAALSQPRQRHVPQRTIAHHQTSHSKRKPLQ